MSRFTGRCAGAKWPTRTQPWATVAWAASVVATAAPATAGTASASATLSVNDTVSRWNVRRFTTRDLLRRQRVQRSVPGLVASAP